MRLESMWIHGLRRFGGEQPTRVRFDEPIVCLVGANEVGKSTILDALAMAAGRKDEEGDWIPVAPTDWTRDEELPGEQVIIRLRYRLDDKERRTLRGLESGKQLREVRWLEQVLHVDGSSELLLDPTPVRDKAPRAALAKKLATWLAEDVSADEELEGTPADKAVVAALVESLESMRRDLRSSLGSMSELADHLELEETAEKYEDSGRVAKLAAEIRQVHALEMMEHPHDEGREELADLVPRFVRFEMAARQLADEYDLPGIASDPPPALRNLAELARLDLEKLLRVIESGNSGSVRRMLEEANEVLRMAFEAWSQKPPVTVSFDRTGTSLLIHVQSGSGVPMKPGERSEGLRQFVALVALTAGEGHTVDPILLIDEAEMHLHYDAQADLMETLAKQTTAAQIIYTTHSAACLPEDLGSSVRVVRGLGEEMRSTVDQQFFSVGAGLVPLLLAMGAGSMAFVPLRPAVIAEGRSELILLPSLIKEAIRQPRLGYQVVPGAAQVPPTRIAGLDWNGAQTVWVLDGDQGGKDRRKYLRSNQIEVERIHLLRESTGGHDLEDLVRPATYARAVRNYAADHGVDAEFTEEDLPAQNCARHLATEAWCRQQGVPEPGKPAIADKVLALRGEEALVDPARAGLLRDLHKELRQQLRVR
jgi:energy-coupling factor transporter ATP-binding protein EcfA2